MTLVLKVDCRSCSRECGDYKHLLDETVIDEESTTLAALLHYCTTLECFLEGDNPSLPEHICNSCVEHLLQSYLFKEMVLQNDRAFKERLEAEEVQVEEIEKPIEIPNVGAEEYIEQEIDVGGVEEENVEELYVENEPDVQSITEAEYEMEEWLEIDEASESAITEVAQAECEDENILPDSIVENEIKIEDNDDDKNLKYEIVDDDGGFIITTTTEELENESDSGEVLIGFDSPKDQEEDDSYETQELKTYNEENDATKVVKKRSVKTNGLTEAELTCQYCGKKFDKMCRLREHSYVHTGEKPHECKICGKRSRTKTHYNVHMLTHSDEKRYKCGICGQHYRTSTSLRVHERKHSNIRPYACELCDKAFHTAEQRKLHRMLHTGERPFSCGTCGKSYRENHSLKLHMQSHDDKKPFQCEVCGKGLTQMSGYRRHMLLHTNEYPYKCDICSRPFRISSNLVAHKRLHLNILPYKCDICDKGFNNSTRLKRHMVQHEPKEEVFKPRKPRQDAVIVESRLAKSNVVEIL